ncbi:MAG: hypothetical protein GY864_00585 [Desulfobacterales bacterium]|nr:hypothetical protein [Desulfobacterales bacterium]
MGFTVEQDCPQCGAPIQLDEADHILSCPYCDVKSFLFAPDYYRFVLPHKAVNRDIFYAPYLRFKGAVYYCNDLEIGYRIVDITNAGLPFKDLPMSLGLRPQAMNIKFVTPDTKGSFLRFALKATDIIERAGKLSSAARSGKLLHRAYIGETLSLIYLPLYVEKNRLFDVVLQRPIGKSEGNEISKHINRNPGWKLIFMPTLCPRCGWNLTGEKDSIVLTCRNCGTAWEASKGKFVRVRTLKVQGQDKGAIYLPFWKISVIAKGIEINSFADFIRLTNQPRALGEEWEKQEMTFWGPAFKIRPKIFLNLSRQLTVSQQILKTEEAIPEKNVYPVTLPRTESIQSMKLTLAGSAMSKKRILPLLPRIRFEAKDSALIYLPFTDTGHEMTQEHMRISINKKAMEFGRRL